MKVLEKIQKWKNDLLDFATGRRYEASENRAHVAQNLMLLTIFIFFVFIINFAIIIATDTKFGVNLSEGAKSVYQTTQIIQAKRGTIYDRSGNAIAEDSTTYSVYAVIDEDYVSVQGDPLYVQSSQYSQLAAIFKKYLDIDEDYTVSQLSQEGLNQVSFGTNGSNITYSNMSTIEEELEKAGIEGVAFTASPGRMYANGVFASQFIGLAQLQENEDGSKSLVGATGLEATMDDILAGTDGVVTYQKDRNGNTMLGTGVVETVAVDGKDVYTTLSAPIQTYLETQMDAFFEKTGGTYASATLVSAKTGEILATTQRPTFNSDTLEGLDDENFTWQNVLYQTNFEPGSTMKVMTLASAIDSGNFDPNESFSNADGLKIADAEINDWEINLGESTGRYMTLAQGFAYSSNVGMTILQQKMGDELWLNYLQKYKFGLPTRFGMGNEATGLLPTNNIVSIAMSAFGQAIATTQTQMLRAFSSIANDGVMLEPQFISQIYDPNTETTRISEKEIVGKPISEEAAAQTREYMITVGTDSVYGTLYNETTNSPVIKVGNENVAVKSGTAQIAKEDGTGYMTGDNDYIYSAVAMVPAEDPEFIMYTTIHQGENFTHYDWENLINPILEEAMAMKDTLNQSVATDLTKQTEYTVGDVIGQGPGTIADELRRNLVHPIVLGTGDEITKISVEADENIEESQQILIMTNNFTQLPDMYGWTKDNVETFAEWTGITVNYKGDANGIVIDQSIEVGTEVKGIKKITVTIGEEE